MFFFLKPSHISIIVLILCITIIPNVFAERGINFDRTTVQMPDGTIQGTITYYTNNFLLDYDGTYKPYHYSEDANTIQVESEQGSFVYDKNQCSISMFDSGHIISGQQPLIKSDSFVLKGAALNSNNWVLVNQINNAACQTTVTNLGDYLRIDAIKSVPNIGSLQISWEKKLLQPLETILTVTNLNPAWNNNKIGITETVQIPTIITLGDQTIDLSTKNNVKLDRTWIINHKAMVTNLTNKLHYDFTNAFPFFSNMTVLYSNGQASIALDYLNNNHKLAPGNSASIDPIYGYTSGTNYQVVTTQTTAATCGTPLTKQSGAFNDVTIPASTSNAACTRMAYQFPIGSLNGTVIDRAVLKFNSTAVATVPGVGGAANLYINGMNVTTDLSIWNVTSSTPIYSFNAAAGGIKIQSSSISENKNYTFYRTGSSTQQILTLGSINDYNANFTINNSSPVDLTLNVTGSQATNLYLDGVASLTNLHYTSSTNVITIGNHRTVEIVYGTAIPPSGTTLVTCTITGIADQPATSTAATLWSDIATGTSFTTTDTACKSLVTNSIIDLGSTGVTYVQGRVNNAVTSNWAGIGFMASSEARLTVPSSITFGANSVQLAITYHSLTPSAPINMVVHAHPNRNTITWSAPISHGTTSITNYNLYRTSAAYAKVPLPDAQSYDVSRLTGYTNMSGNKALYHFDYITRGVITDFSGNKINSIPTSYTNLTADSGVGGGSGNDLPNIRATLLTGLTGGAYVKFVGVNMTALAGHTKVAVYNGGAGGPNVMLANSSSVLMSGQVNRFFNVTLNNLAKVPANGTIWVAFQDDNAGATWNFKGIPAAYSVTAHTYSNNFPTIFPQPATSDLNQPQMIAIYSTSNYTSPQIRTNGLFNGTAYLNGENEYINMTNSTTQIYGTGNFTVHSWIFPNGSATNNLLAFKDTLGNNVMFGENTTHIYGKKGANYIFQHGKTLNSGRWQDIDIVRAGNTWKTYSNGTLVSTTTNTTSLGTVSGNKYYIGSNGDATGTFARGLYDDYALFNSAKSASDISNMAARGLNTLSIITELGNVTTTDDSGLATNATWYYRTQAINSGGNGTISDVAGNSTASLPGIPLSLTATVVSTNRIDLSCVPGSNGNDPIVGYQVKRNGTTLINSTSSLCVLYSDQPINVYSPQNYSVAAWNGVGLGPFRSVISSTLGPTIPGPVSDLQSTTITESTIGLAWSQPNLNGQTLIGYQINYTTPYGTPQTVLVNNTGTSSSIYTVSSLTSNTQYSFRIGVWTTTSSNANGNILNVLTSQGFTQSNFTVGYININQTNPLVQGITFTRADAGTTTTLTVKYPTTYNMTYALHYDAAQLTQTYHNQPSVNLGNGYSTTTFTFHNATNDVIHVLAQDVGTNSSGKYVLTEASFGAIPLIQQIKQFKAGTFGTTGELGAIDIVTLIVLIIAMVGLNRVNETVGAVIMVMIIGAIAYFGIVDWPVVITAAVALIILVIVTSTRKLAYS